MAARRRRCSCSSTVRRMARTASSTASASGSASWTERKSSASRRRCSSAVSAVRGSAPSGRLRRCFDHRAHVGTHGGKFALVLVETAFGDEVGLARTRPGKSLEESALGVGERVSVRGDGVAAFGGGVFELGADQSGVDAESLGGVVGKSVARDAAGDAADVGQEEVEGLGFGFRIARGKEAAGALDEVILILRRGAQGFSVGAGRRVRGRSGRDRGRLRA